MECFFNSEGEAQDQQELLPGDRQEVPGREGVKVQLLEHGGETYVLARRTAPASKESAMYRRLLVGLKRKLRARARNVKRAGLCDEQMISRRLGLLEERYVSVWPYLQECGLRGSRSPIRRRPMQFGCSELILCRRFCRPVRANFESEMTLIMRLRAAKM